MSKERRGTREVPGVGGWKRPARGSGPRQPPAAGSLRDALMNAVATLAPRLRLLLMLNALAANGGDLHVRGQQAACTIAGMLLELPCPLRGLPIRSPLPLWPRP